MRMPVGGRTGSIAWDVALELLAHSGSEKAAPIVESMILSALRHTRFASERVKQTIDTVPGVLEKLEALCRLLCG